MSSWRHRRSRPHLKYQAKIPEKLSPEQIKAEKEKLRKYCKGDSNYENFNLTSDQKILAKVLSTLPVPEVQFFFFLSFYKFSKNSKKLIF